jgi:hypothetical protein
VIVLITTLATGGRNGSNGHNGKGKQHARRRIGYHIEMRCHP